MEAGSPESFFTSLALLALVVFFLIPNKFLGSGSWGVALVLCVLVFALTDAHPWAQWETWAFLFGAIGCIGHWFYKVSHVEQKGDLDNGPST